MSFFFMATKGFDDLNNSVPVLTEQEVNSKIEEAKADIEEQIQTISSSIPSTDDFLSSNIGTFSSSANTNSDGRVITDIVSVGGSASGGQRISSITYKTFTTSRVSNISGTLSNVLSRLAQYAHSHSFGSATKICPCNNVCSCNCDDNDNGN